MSVVLGEKYTDSITGINGIAISSTTYLYGCIIIGLSQVDKDGKEFTAYFDEPRLSPVDVDVPPVESLARSGGPHDAPPSRQVP